MCLQAQQIRHCWLLSFHCILEKNPCHCTLWVTAIVLRSLISYSAIITEVTLFRAQHHMMKTGLGRYQHLLLPPGSLCQLGRCYFIKSREAICFSKKFKGQEGKFKWKTSYHHLLTSCKLLLGNRQIMNESSTLGWGWCIRGQSLNHGAG